MEQHTVEAIAEFNAGVRAQRAGDGATAVAHWTRAVTLDPEMVPALRNLAVAYDEARNPERVAAVYAQVLAVDPFDTDALIRQAAAYRQLGDYAPAVANYERAIAVYPYFRFWYDELGDLLELAGDLGGAAAWRDRAAGLDSDEAEMAFEDGIRQLRAGNPDLAAAIFEAVIDDHPGNLDARLQLGRVLHTLGRTSEALEHIAAGVELAGVGRARLLVERARILEDLGREGDAAAELDVALAEEPGYGLARRLRARLGAGAPAGRARGGVTGASPVARSADSGAASSPGMEASPAAAPDAPASPPPTSVSIAKVRSASQAAGTSALGAMAAPSFAAPDAERPWLEQVRFVARQALGVPSPSGVPGNVAVLMEAAEPVAMVADAILQLLARPELGLVAGGESRVYCVEADTRAGETELGIRAEGWLGRDFREPRYARWSLASDGMPIDRMLEAATLAVGSEGFNVVFVIGTGGARAGQDATASYLRPLPTYQVALVQSATGPSELAGRFDGVAPNFVVLSTVARH
ncbi:MAG: tetratricopeptide repeat protein [Myxococcales bacterium]|nr:tetratricopeptide repeat protein [Myxococcales bacterium]